jgi:hypothetical protein
MADLLRFNLFGPQVLFCNVFSCAALLADEVLVNTEDMHRLADELRAKINGKIRSWSGVADPTEEQEREVSVVIRCVRVFRTVCQEGSRGRPCCELIGETTLLCFVGATDSLTVSPVLAQFVHLLFHEIDQDGSGTIDKGEFRMMLRKLNLTYR